MSGPVPAQASGVVCVSMLSSYVEVARSLDKQPPALFLTLDEQEARGVAAERRREGERGVKVVARSLKASHVSLTIYAVVFGGAK